MVQKDIARTAECCCFHYQQVFVSETALGEKESSSAIPEHIAMPQEEIMPRLALYALKHNVSFAVINNAAGVFSMPPLPSHKRQKKSKQHHSTT